MTTCCDVDPFPLLTLPDLVLQSVLTHLTPKERKATRGTCKKLCKVASAAVHYFHVGATREESYLDYLNLHEKFPNIQVLSLADELVASDGPFGTLVTLSLCKLKNLCCMVLLNNSLAVSAAGMATLVQCKHIKQLVMAAPSTAKGPLMAANTQAMAAMIALLPGLSHLLLLPNQQPDLAAGTAATLAAGAAGLLPMQQLQRSRLREWQMGEAALRGLEGLHGLVQLEVGCDPAGLHSLSSLSPLSNLKHLALRGLGLEAGLQLCVLGDLPMLRSLSLVDSAIIEDSLEHVGRCTKLTRLELQGCQRLREQSLSHLVSLHRLSTFRCSLPLSEAGLASLITAAGPQLTALEADCIEVPVMDPLNTSLAAQTSAGIHNGAAGAASGTAARAASGYPGFPSYPYLGQQLPGLHVLRLRRITSSIPQLWQFAPGLTSLVVWGEASNTGLIRAFSGHCPLRRLALCCEHTSDAGLAALSGLCDLQELTLCEGTAISAQRLVGVIHRLSRLQVLQLSHMKHLSDDSLAALITAARQLKALGLQEPGRVTEQGFALLAGFLHLHSLWVDSCNLGTAVLMALACNPSLQLLEVHRSHPEAETLSMQQLQLLARVTGPRLEVVLREGHRPREEVLGMQAGQGSTLCGGQTAGWGFQEGFDLFNPTEALLEPGQFRVMGSGMVLGPDVGQLAAVWQPDWLPDLGGLHL